MNVLSLFDGMSCGQQALVRAGIKYDKYFASEIDKYAITVTMANFPETIQLGSVTEISNKLIYLSEVYTYICDKYFNNDLQSLQSIIPEWEILYRINEEQVFTAYFGTQKQGEVGETQSNPNLSINDRIWFWKHKVGDNKGIYDIIRGGTRGKKTNIDVSELCKHSFWWDGYGQHESGIDKKSIGWIERENSERINKINIEGSSEKAIFNKRIKGKTKNESNSTISRPNKETEIFGCYKINKQSGIGSKKENNTGKEKTREIYDNEKIVSTNNENDRICEDNRVLLSICEKIQVTVIECEWGVLIFKGDIKITFGGSPCQSFSFAGKRKGMSTKDSQEILTLDHYLQLKSEQYEFEGQSYLFWEYMRLIKETNPTYFLLENVKMTKKWENVLTNAIGIEPIMINSALVSAQNRKRLYWTNIGAEKTGLFGEMKSIIKQPEDKGILLKDVLQDNPNAIYYMKPEQIKRMLERINVDVNVTESSILDVYNRKIKTDGKCITLLDPKHNNMRLVEPIPVDDKYYLSPKMVEYLNTRKANFNSGKINYKTDEDKASCINKSSGSLDISDNIIIAMRGRKGESDTKYEQNMEERKDGKTNCLTTSVTKDNLVVVGGDFRYDEGFRWKEDEKSPTLRTRWEQVLVKSFTEVRTEEAKKIRKETGTNSKGDKELSYRKDDKTGVLLTSLTNDNLVEINYPNTSKIRKLTPIECERLQTVSDNYTAFVSDTQRYKMLGNGWTVDVIAHIFSYIK